jgi:type IV pilus assembly protein PilM
MFLNPFPNALGLDINDLSIKVVQLRNISRRRIGPAFELVAARKVTLPHGLVTNGVIHEPERVRTYIRHLLDKKDKNGNNLVFTNWVVASLPDSQGFIKLIHLDKPAEDILPDDVEIAAQKHVPLEEDEYYLDWQIMPTHENTSKTSHVLLAAVPKQIGDMYTYLLESLEKTVVALEMQGLATARSMITYGKTYENEGRAILDICASKTTLIIYDHGHVQFSRCLKMNGEKLTTNISQTLHIPYEEAEIKKRDHGLNYKKNNKVWNIISKQMDSLIQEVDKTIQFYYSHFPHPNKITNITLSGGASNMQGIEKVLTDKLKISTKHGKAWKNLLTKKNIQIDERMSAHFATAIGLALRAADNPFFRGDAI